MLFEVSFGNEFDFKIGLVWVLIGVEEYIVFYYNVVFSGVLYKILLLVIWERN